MTNLELSILKAIDDSEYGDELGGSIWTFSVWDNIDRSVCKNRTSLSGGVSSLVQKGLVRIAGSGRDAEIAMTAEGVRTYLAACKDQGRVARKFLAGDEAVGLYGADAVAVAPLVRTSGQNEIRLYDNVVRLWMAEAVAS